MTGSDYLPCRHCGMNFVLKCKPEKLACAECGIPHEVLASREVDGIVCCLILRGGDVRSVKGVRKIA
jgi:hypothetical protein